MTALNEFTRPLADGTQLRLTDLGLEVADATGVVIEALPHEEIYRAHRIAAQVEIRRDEGTTTFEFLTPMDADAFAEALRGINPGGTRRLVTEASEPAPVATTNNSLVYVVAVAGVALLIALALMAIVAV
jgi:hypothetical protein